MADDSVTGSARATRLLLSEGAGYTLVEILQQTVALLALPVFFFFLTAEDFGVITMSMVLAQLGSAIGGLGLDFSVMRLYFRWEDTQRAQVVAGVTLICGVWSAVLVGICHILLSAGSVPAEHYWPLTLGWWSGLVLAIRSTPLSLVRIQGAVRIYATFVLGGAALQVFVQSVSIAAGWGAFGYMLGYVSGGAVSAALALRAVRSQYRWTRTAWRLPTEIVWYTARILPSVLFSRLIAVADRMVLSRWVSTEALGVYGAAARLSTPVKVLSGGFKMALAPVLSRVERRDDFEVSFGHLARFVVIGMLLVGSLVTVGVWFLEYTPWASQSADVQRLVALLLMAQFLSGLSYLGQLRLYYSAWPSAASIVVGVNALVLLVGLIVLVPGRGVVGAAIAELAAGLVAVLTLIGLVLLTMRRLRPWPTISAPLLTFVPCFAAAWMTRGLDQLGVLVFSVIAYALMMGLYLHRENLLPVPGLRTR